MQVAVEIAESAMRGPLSAYCLSALTQTRSAETGALAQAAQQAIDQGSLAAGSAEDLVKLFRAAFAKAPIPVTMSRANCERVYTVALGILLERYFATRNLLIGVNRRGT